jgi:hypothetical protein
VDGKFYKECGTAVEPLTTKKKETPTSSGNTTDTKEDNIGVGMILIVIVGVIGIIYALLLIIGQL